MLLFADMVAAEYADSPSADHSLLYKAISLSKRLKTEPRVFEFDATQHGSSLRAGVKITRSAFEIF